MDARKYLKRALNLKERIKNKTLELEQWEAIATKMTASVGGERVQSSTSLHKMEDAAIKIVEIENQTIEMRAKYSHDLQEIIDIIDKIEDVESYSILHKRYVQGKTVEQIRDEECISQSTSDRRFEKAYKIVQSILDEVENGK